MKVKCPICHEVNCWYLKFLAVMCTVGSCLLVLGIVLR